ncbi:MAG: hypothetical protein AAB426_10060 [Myxococcota bacterium]
MRTIVYASCCATLIAASAFAAEAPPVIGYHGVLANAVGERVSVSLPVIFRVYDSANGGNLLWQETHNAVAFADGLFDVALGAIEPLDASMFADGTPLWLTLQVDADVEMTPRQQLVSVPYALHASNADTVGGISAASLEESGEISFAVAAHVANASAHPLTTFEMTQSPSSPITTTSTSDVVTGLSVTPGVGTYLVMFSCSLQNSNASRSQTVSLYVGGSQVAGSERSANSVDANRPTSLSVQAVLTVGVGQAVEVRWRTEANTATMLGRTLTMLRLQ